MDVGYLHRMQHAGGERAVRGWSKRALGREHVLPGKKQISEAALHCYSITLLQCRDSMLALDHTLKATMSLLGEVQVQCL